jgi:predicted enzyme related to lactoylglutathione lyase
MTDPLDALRAPVEPVDPDPIFAERLRAELRRAALRGAAMTEMTTTTPSTAEAEAALPWPPSLTPYIVVSDARAALDWYVEVFGATRRGGLYVNADGTIGHAEIGIGDAVLMLAEQSDLWPDVPVGPPPEPPTKHSHTLHLQMSDVDGTTRRAAARGASVEREPTDQPYGRGSVIVDPFGHRWMLLRPPGRATRKADGDVSYVTMVVADDEAAKEFYGAVFGWEFEAGSLPGAWGPVGKGGEYGIWADPTQRPEVQLCYKVSDIEAAARRVREHGGQAGAIERKPYGLKVDCVDNQGAKFQLWEPVD